jgi:hypothetical protein
LYFVMLADDDCLRRHQGALADHRANHIALEAAVRGRGIGRAGHLSSRPTGGGGDTCSTGKDLGGDTAATLNVSKEMVHRVWREAGLKRRRLERYLASNLSR